MDKAAAIEARGSLLFLPAEYSGPFAGAGWIG